MLRRYREGKFTANGHFRRICREGLNARDFAIFGLTGSEIPSVVVAYFRQSTVSTDFRHSTGSLWPCRRVSDRRNPFVESGFPQPTRKTYHGQFGKLDAGKLHGVRRNQVVVKSPGDHIRADTGIVCAAVEALSWNVDVPRGPSESPGRLPIHYFARRRFLELSLL